jgi:hypothetical protein
VDPPRNRSLPVLIASMLCYIWGAIMVGLAIVVLVPMFSRRGFAIAAALFPFIVLVIAVTYCVMGYLIGRRRRFGAWLGVTVATLTALLQLVMHLNIMRINLTPGWLAVDALLLVLLLSNWRRFDQVAPRVGA